MGNKLIIFPVEKQAAAAAYQAAVNAHYAANYEPGGAFAYLWNDVYGQWVVPYLGPPWEWNGVAVAEPAELVPYRVDGVMHDFAIWPNDED